MNQVTKRFPVKKCIVKLPQAKSLARVFLDIYSQSKKPKKNKFLVFTITLDNKDVNQRSDLTIFDKDESAFADRVKSIEMRFSTHPVDTQVTAILTHDSLVEPQNEVTVFGNDEIWVDGIFKRLNDIVKSFEPQNSFIERFNWPVVLFLSVSIGSLLGLFVNALISWFSVAATVWPFIDTLLFPKELVDYTWRYIVCALIGLAPALFLRDWLKTFWPSVEIQIGPEHKFVEKHKRNRLTQWMLIAIVPILLQLVYDLFSN